LIWPSANETIHVLDYWKYLWKHQKYRV